MIGRNDMIRKSSLVIALCAGAAVGVASGQAGHPQGGGQAGRAVRLDVVQNSHVRTYKVSQADAASTSATLVSGSGREIPGFRLENRVLVKSEDVNLVRKLALSATPAMALQAPVVQASADVPGWVVVETGTVRDAAEISRVLSNSGLFESVSVDWEEPRGNRSLPNDPMVSQQWYLENTSRPGDLNVSPVYDLGITGEGITVGILETGDDNFQPDHPDLAANYAESISMAMTPFPTVDGQSHPTWVAGVIAGVGNNGIGIAGVAYDANLARLRNGTKLVRARAMQWYYNRIGIQSNSWGPANPPFLYPAHTEDEYVMDALERSMRLGRGGKGVIFLYASGNDYPDRVDYEPLGSSRYTIAIGAVDENMDIADYSQAGTSLFATAYSGPAMPSPFLRNVVTTAPESDYFTGFSGTSAACPMAAGVVALMLQANPNLTYRDVQHIIADTAIPTNFENDGIYFYAGAVVGSGNTWWQVNGAYTRHSDDYGFGVIDAEAAVSAALTWTGVPNQRFLDTYDVIPADTTIPGAEFVEFPEGNDPPSYVINTALEYPGLSWTDTICVKTDIQIEAVELILTTTGAWVGDLEILLTSPYGTVSPLAMPRPDPSSYTSYIFTTLKHWDEPSAGEWTIRITDFIPDGPFDQEDATVDLAPFGLDGIPGAGEKGLVSYRLKFYGTDFAGAEPYLCDPNNQDCPGDLNGDGIVSPADLIFFLNLYNAGDPFCDVNGDGIVTYDDLLQFFNSFRPGFCPSPDNDGPGGRPVPGGSNNGQPVGGGGAG